MRGAMSQNAQFETEGTDQVRRPRSSTQITAHVPRDLAAQIHELAAARGLSVSAATAGLLAEALRMNVEHQHGALIEAAIDRAVGQRLARLEDLAARSAIHAYRGRWLLARTVALLGDRMAAQPSQGAEERASRLNTESHRKARAWLGEDGWAEPS
jgi:Ribbon-helix-helix protein, copG family